jgi:hypothetical protein
MSDHAESNESQISALESGASTLLSKTLEMLKADAGRTKPLFFPEGINLIELDAKALTKDDPGLHFILLIAGPGVNPKLRTEDAPEE